MGKHGTCPRPPALAASGSPAVHGHLGQGLGSRGLYLQNWWPASGSTGSLPLCDPSCWVFLWEVAKTALAPGRAEGLGNTVERGPQLLLGRPRVSFVAGQGPLGPVGAESAYLGRIPREFRGQGYQVECPLGSWGWPGSDSLCDLAGGKSLASVYPPGKQKSWKETRETPTLTGELPLSSCFPFWAARHPWPLPKSLEVCVDGASWPSTPSPPAPHLPGSSSQRVSQNRPADRKVSQGGVTLGSVCVRSGLPKQSATGQEVQRTFISPSPGGWEAGVSLARLVPPEASPLV